MNVSTENYMDNDENTGLRPHCTVLIAFFLTLKQKVLKNQEFSHFTIGSYHKSEA
jgi:hypothetical protein